MDIRTALICLAGACLLAPALAGASSKWIPSPPARDIEASLARLKADANANKAAVDAGRRAAFFCANCHGKVGVSSLEHIPNLAGQNAFYLLTQIDKYGDGRRTDEFMSGLVKVLKPEDRFNIAVFYANQSVPPTPARDARLAAVGARHYDRACKGCHGPRAHGTREVARLAGQREGYIVSALKHYRDAAGVRADPRMTGVAKKLSDQDIVALAQYLGTLP
jgi:cytochrome c553